MAILYCTVFHGERIVFFFQSKLTTLSLISALRRWRWAGAAAAPVTTAASNKATTRATGIFLFLFSGERPQQQHRRSRKDRHENFCGGSDVSSHVHPQRALAPDWPPVLANGSRGSRRQRHLGRSHRKPRPHPPITWPRSVTSRTSPRLRIFVVAVVGHDLGKSIPTIVTSRVPYSIEGLIVYSSTLAVGSISTTQSIAINARSVSKMTSSWNVLERVDQNEWEEVLAQQFRRK